MKLRENDNMSYSDVGKKQKYQKLYMKKYRQTKTYKSNKKLYRKLHSEQIAKYFKKYRQQNKEHLKQKDYDYYQRNKQCIGATVKQYQQTEKGKDVKKKNICKTQA